MEVIFRFPQIFAINEHDNCNLIQQLALKSEEKRVFIEPYSGKHVKGYILRSLDESNRDILAITNATELPKQFQTIIKVKISELPETSVFSINLLPQKWIRHPLLSDNANNIVDYKARISQIFESWKGAFKYISEDQEKNISGLRPPQIGAIHAVLAHWTVTNRAATVVMPTGTGKTETMLSILVSSQCQKLFVVVPTDALRTQIYNKFLTLGMLKELGVVSKDALYPIIGLLKHKPKNIEEINSFFEKCNVVVTTMAIAGQCFKAGLKHIADLCPVLFIDEAHHVVAETWDECKEQFKTNKIVQFTATPYRNDDKPIDGDIIFNYPLKKAQEDGYFTTINFKPVVEFDISKADQAIAAKAVEQLMEDSKKYNHILMARVSSIERAEQVFQIYKQYHNFNPVQIHMGIKSITEREKIRKMIIEGQSRIVVCVDMLGEGFDLPQLKIAAFHDIKKSLPITLQLAGRFTRSRTDLGEATFIANIGEISVDRELEKLYSQDADWNIILRKTSQDIIQEQIDFKKFIDNFGNSPKEIPLQNIRTAMSAVAYKTKCENWKPENFKAGIEGIDSLEHIYHEINYKDNILIVVTAKKVPIDWVRMGDMFNWDWQLFILYWDKPQNLLFIHSSTNNGYFKKMAESVAGEVDLIRGADLFRCFYGINRLKLQNVGLIEQLGRLIKYTMRAGSDVEPGLTDAQKRNVIKSNIFGVGFENGHKVSIGCSYKGRVWSHSTTNIELLTRWCSFVGGKILNSNIDVESVLKGTLVPIIITNRPQKIPIAIEWPEDIYKEAETACSLSFEDGTRFALYNFDLNLVNPMESGDLQFEIASESIKLGFSLILFEKDDIKDYKISIIGNFKVSINIGSRSYAIEDFFNENPPTIWFADGSSLEGNSLTEIKSKYGPYEKEKIIVWDWAGINIKKEVQGIAKDSDSIQFKVIEEIKKRDFDVIFNDHGSGESADVVAIKNKSTLISVELYHCKKSHNEKPGKRIDDLYEVCGQAQKSIHWSEDASKLFNHLLAREPYYTKGNQISRFERGDKTLLVKLREMSRIHPTYISIFIVQPGLSKSEITTYQQEILSVTENYLMETYKLPFGVVANA